MSTPSITADQWIVLSAVCGSAQRRLTSGELHTETRVANPVEIANSLVNLGLLRHDASSETYKPTVKGWAAYNR